MIFFLNASVLEYNRHFDMFYQDNLIDWSNEMVNLYLK